METSLLKRDIVVNGVRLLAGFLCKTNDQGGVEPQRATMFCFNVDDAKDAFGKQFFESQKNEIGITDLIATLNEVLKKKGSL